MKLYSYLDNTAMQPATYGGFDVNVPGPYVTMRDMVWANARAGGHYFDADAKKFFRSRISPTVYYGRFFIDSIQFVSSQGVKAPREYKIVAVDDTGHTRSVIAKNVSGTWQKDFPTLAQVKHALTRLVQEGV